MTQTGIPRSPPSPELDAEPLAPVLSSAGAKPPSLSPLSLPPAPPASTVCATSAVPVGLVDVNRTVHDPGEPNSMALA
jgi:hypothetical protein